VSPAGTGSVTCRAVVEFGPLLWAVMVKVTLVPTAGVALFTDFVTPMSAAVATMLSGASTVLLTITADTCGRHDTLGGACANESNMVRYAIEKRFMHACRSSFLRGLMEWGRGMEKRDITSNINFFMNVPVTPEGKLTFEDGISEPGKYVEMRAETDVLCAISNCPQLNNPCNAYNPTPVQVLIWESPGD